MPGTSPGMTVGQFPFASYSAGRLRLAGVLAHQIDGGGASGHLGLQLLEAPAGIAFAIVDHLDCCFAGQGPGHEWVRVLADASEITGLPQYHVEMTPGC